MVMVQRIGVVWLLLASFGCERSHGAELVGDQCLPDPIPSAASGVRGFFSSESYLQQNAPDCQGHACLVHRLDNGSGGRVPADPTNLCTDADARPGCVTREALDQSVHCSCQCDGPGSRDDYCTCPNGFLCRQLFTLEQDGLHDAPGSFCVRPSSGTSSSNTR